MKNKSKVVAIVYWPTLYFYFIFFNWKVDPKEKRLIKKANINLRYFQKEQMTYPPSKKDSKKKEREKDVETFTYERLCRGDSRKVWYRFLLFLRKNKKLSKGVFILRISPIWKLGTPDLFCSIKRHLRCPPHVLGQRNKDLRNVLLPWQPSRFAVEANQSRDAELKPRPLPSSWRHHGHRSWTN